MEKLDRILRIRQCFRRRLYGGGGNAVNNKNDEKIIKKMKTTITDNYHDPTSSAFEKSAQLVRQIVLKNLDAKHKHLLTLRLVRDTLERSIAYSITRHLNKNKYFHGTSFYSPNPHHRWHVDLQDMSLFRKAAGLKRGDAFNFLLVCVDDFSNYIMVKPLRNKQADTVLKCFEAIIKREKFRYFPSIIYCDKSTEFDNKIFTNPKKVNFKVQFTIDRRKAVYAEHAIRTIRQSLEQYYIGRINEAPSNYKDIIQTIVQSHNESPSLSAPLILNPNDNECEPKRGNRR